MMRLTKVMLLLPVVAWDNTFILPLASVVRTANTRAAKIKGWLLTELAVEWLCDNRVFFR